MSNQIHDSSSQEPKSNDNTDGVQYEKAEIFNTYPEVWSTWLNPPLSQKKPS